LLFLIHINDLPKCRLNAEKKQDMFAPDTQTATLSVEIKVITET
jgi:hypothetical protein